MVSFIGPKRMISVAELESSVRCLGGGWKCIRGCGWVFQPIQFIGISCKLAIKDIHLLINIAVKLIKVERMISILFLQDILYPTTCIYSIFKIMILASKVQKPCMWNNFNVNPSNFEEIINTYFWLVVVDSSTTLPTREVVTEPATNFFEMQFLHK